MRAKTFAGRKTLAAILWLVVLGAPLPAAASSAINYVTGVSVEALNGGYSRVDVTFAGNAPSDSQLSGAGGTTVLLQIPAASAPASILGHQYSGANGIRSVTASSVGGVTLVIELTAPLHVAAAISGHDVVVDVDAPIAVSAQAVPNASNVKSAGANVGGRTYESIRLQYADVSEVANILAGSGQPVPPAAAFQPEGSIFSLPTSTGSQVSATNNAIPISGQEPLAARLTDSVAYDRRLNAIVLSGTPDEISAMKNLIAQVDVPAESVVLECKVLELSDATAKDLGLGLNSGAGTPIAVGSASVGGTPGSKPQYGATLQGDLYATIERDGGKVLATPTVLATDNIPAQILTGDALPIINTTVIPGASAVTQTSVNYIAVGVNLQIEPHVADDGYVTSDIFAEVSSVTSYVTTSQGSVPEISLRQISTLATVKDGQPFIVGGLFLDEEIASMTRIPMLSDLPVLGGLFRARHDSSSHSNLYVIVTPHVVHLREGQR